ncbi:amino acid permease [Pontibacillus salicampi]|uniref:Amino acid permease n=1 Tax=Pontibacillus salicampi TaxID=1449801 RepID=A0ABV6LPP6_9BACI
MGNRIGTLKWWQLSLIGVGCTIGTGYFLGSSIAIQLGGPIAVASFFIAGIGTYIVYMALAHMTMDHPEKGSFRAYSKNAFGHWAGFCNGWIYWTSELLILGSQLTAIGLFMKFWFKDIPLWILTLVFAVLGLIVIFTGVKTFEKMENIFAVIKSAAILMFIILACLGIFGLLSGGEGAQLNEQSFLPKGITGAWGSLLYAFYAFGGIEMMGLMATELKDTNDAPKAGKLMLILLTLVYVLSIGGALLLAPWKSFTPDESPFITALEAFNLPLFSHLFNGVFIIAGFSTMVAALYAVTTMLVSLSETGDAPKVFSHKGKRDFPMSAIAFTTSGMGLSIIIALLLPEKVYEYITTAAGLMVLLNWVFILLAFRTLIQAGNWKKVQTWIGLILVLFALTGALLQESTRPGVWVAAAFLGLIGIGWRSFRQRIMGREEDQQ